VSLVVVVVAAVGEEGRQKKIRQEEILNRYYLA
jgi:hypothetical protein